MAIFPHAKHNKIKYSIWEGTFDDFGLSMNPLGLTKTVVSFIPSPLHVPVRRLFKEGLPEDGLEACKAMWKASEEIEDNK